MLRSTGHLKRANRAIATIWVDICCTIRFQLVAAPELFCPPLHYQFDLNALSIIAVSSPCHHL